jgi:DNA-binding NarL/FixJ family response regulator
MRIVIVADHPMAAEAIRRGLRHTPGCQVLGYVDGRRPAALPVANARPDVVLLDEPEVPESALARIRDLRAAAPEAKLVLLTPRMETDWLADAAKAGIDAAIARNGSLESVGMLVREVVAGNVFHVFRAVSVAPQRNDGAAEGITARELEILRLVANGASNGRIAAELWVTEQTVKFHLSNIYRKLGVANRTEASHYAHVHGFLEPAAMPAPAAVPAPVRLAVAA